MAMHIMSSTASLSLLSHRRSVQTQRVRAVASEEFATVKTTVEDKVKLGGSDLNITKLGIGAWSWGDTSYWNNFEWDAKMHDKITAEDLLGNIMETIADNIPKQKSSFFEGEQSGSVTSQINRLFGRQKPVHHLLGGGKSADVLLWRNKKISASVLTAATVIWILFEWLNYHFLTLVCLALVLGMVAQFFWTNVSGFMNRSSARVPRLVLPDELFVNVARSIGAQVNQALIYLQDISCGGNLKQFLMVVVSLWAAAVIGSWCNFLTVIYIGFVGAHTLPVLYERYEDEVDSFVYHVLGQFQHHYRKVNTGFFSKIPRGRRGWKHD